MVTLQKSSAECPNLMPYMVQGIRWQAYTGSTDVAAVTLLIDFHHEPYINHGEKSCVTLLLIEGVVKRLLTKAHHYASYVFVFMTIIKKKEVLVVLRII